LQKETFSSKRIIALYLKAEKEKKKKDMQHKGTALQEKDF